MSRASERRLRLMYDANGIIAREMGVDILKIYARGDKRTRPIACIERVDVEDWEARKIIVLGDRGFELSAQTSRRILNGVPLSEIEKQAELLPGPYSPPRKVKTRRLSTIDRMERQSHGNGGAVYSAAHIMAARRFAKAVHLSGGGRIATSDTTTPKVDGGSRGGAAEDSTIRRIDNSRALKRATAGLDPRVTRVLNRVVGADISLTRVEREEGWSAGIAEMLLMMGLDHLVRHYGTQAGSRHHAPRRAS